MAVIDFFNSREKAIALWTGVLLVYASFKSEGLGRQLLSLVRVALAPKLVLPALCTAAYSAGLTLAASRLGLWHRTATKETVYWFFGTALVLMGSALSGQAFDWAFVARIIQRAIRVTLVIEFLVGIYVLPFTLEFVLVPLLAMLVGVQTLAERDPERVRVRRFVVRVLVLAGTSVAIYTLVSAVTDLNNLLTTERGEALLLVPAFTLALAPLLYAITTWSRWDRERVMREQPFAEQVARTTPSGAA